MRAMDWKARGRQAAGLTIALGALTFTYACNAAPMAADAAAPQAQAAGNDVGTPVMVSCEPHQRTLVRPTVVNGTAVSHVECVASAAVAPAPAPQSSAYGQPAPAQYAPAPVHYPPPQRVSQPVYTDLGDAQVVPAPARTVRTGQVVYDERPARIKKTRSVKKSAVIIGASAGAGAGVGAAIGGKKGALIGAAIGGGGAAVWDQVTRKP